MSDVPPLQADDQRGDVTHQHPLAKRLFNVDCRSPGADHAGPEAQDPAEARRCLDRVAEWSGLLLDDLGRLGADVGTDPQGAGSDGLNALANLGVSLAYSGRLIEETPTYWVADEPFVRDGFAPCVCVPEYALRLAWRAWCLSLIVAGGEAVGLDPLTPDDEGYRGGDRLLDMTHLVPVAGLRHLVLRWPLVRVALRRLPLREADEVAARLHIEHVSIGTAAIARLRAGMSPSIRYRGHRLCVEEYLRAVEMLPEGWVGMAQEAQLAALVQPRQNGAILHDTPVPVRATATSLEGATTTGATMVRRLPEQAPPMPVVDDNLHVIHYSQELHENVAFGTPQVAAVVVQHIKTGQQYTFAASEIAERGGISRENFLLRLAGLEASLLQTFFEFVRCRPRALWLHWGMRKSGFGFEVLTQRARVHGLEPVEIASERRFDLDTYLKRCLGDGYLPDPRLWNALRFNGQIRPGLLDKEASAAAWAAGEYARVTYSLAFKVTGIADLFERVRYGEFRRESVTPEETGARDSVQYVTLDQAAALVNRSKKSLERCKNKRGSGCPTPDVEGGGGKPNEWAWNRLRPWLERVFGRKLPEHFPSCRRDAKGR
jgi:hypothetical protein